MIPIELQDSLVERFRDEFKHQKLKDLRGNRVDLNVFSQHLPTKNNSKEELYPYLNINLSSGSKSSAEDPQAANILFIIGVMDRDNNNQGYRDAFRIANRIIESLNRNPVQANKYEVSANINWMYKNEELFPYYFVGLETTWSTPNYIREDVENLI